MFKHCLLATFSLAAAITTPIAAQEIDGRVVQDPNAGLAVYTIDLDGPPRGMAQLFVGLWLLPEPIQLTPFGPWWLDPNPVFPLSPLLPVDPFGAAQFQFQVPLNLSAGIPLTFQSVNIDTASNVRLSTNAVALGHNQVPQGPKNVNYTFAYDTGSTELRTAGSAQPGATIEVRIVGPNGTVASGSTVVAPTGNFGVNVTVPGGISDDHDVMILCNGTLVDKVDLHKF